MKEIALSLLKTKAVIVRRDPPFVWTSGIKAPIYTDNRILISYPQYRKQVIDAFLELIAEKDLDFDVIAGTATAGIPWSSWLADRLNLPLVYVRSEKKGHGKENLIEGKLEKGKQVLIVEDLISTGGSSIKTAEALIEAGASVEDIISIFTYELPDSKKNFKNAKLKLYTLTSFSELIDVALDSRYITKDDKISIIKWKDSPWEWD